MRIGNIEFETDGNLEGFAAAAMAELHAASEAVSSSAGSGYHLQLAIAFAQLEIAQQLELLRTEGIKIRDPRL